MRPAAPDHAASAPDGQIPALTGLRGLAALMVAILHLWHFAGQPSWRIGVFDFSPIAICGYFGVDLFFVLSGFLLGLPFVRARMRALPRPSLREFWRRRARRVLPALWVQLAILFTLGWVVTGTAPASAFELLAQATLSFNLFDGIATLNPVYWSLPIEWNFYVALPLLALLFARGSGRPWGLPGVLLLVLIVRLGCVWVVQAWGSDGIPYARWIVQLPSRLDQFVFGMVAAWLVLRGGSRAGGWLAWAGIAIIVVMMWTTAPLGDVMAELQQPRLYWHYTVIGAGFALLIAGAARGAGPGLRTLLESAPLGFLGRISYSLYLWHYPVLEALRTTRLPQRVGMEGPLAWWLLAGSAMLAVSWLSYRFVERPFLAAPPTEVSDPRSGMPAVSSPPPHS